MKKRLVSTLLTVCMVLCLIPIMFMATNSANAETKLTSLKFNVEGYNTGESVYGMYGDVTDISDVKGIEVYNGSSLEFAYSTAGSTVDDFLDNTTTEAFAEDTDYYLGVLVEPLEGYDVSSLTASNITAVCNGTTITASVYGECDGEYLAIFKMPKVTEFTGDYTIEIPVKKTVTLGGKYEPGKTEISLDFYYFETGEKLTAEDLEKYGITVTPFEVSGAGTFEGSIVISSKSYDGLLEFLFQDLVVRETDLSDSHWECSDNYWQVRIDRYGMLSNDSRPLPDWFDPYFYSVTKNEDGSFSIDWEAEYDEISFENVYINNEAPVTPDDEKGDDGKGESDGSTPKTGDESNLGLWMALALMSGVALAGTTVIYRKKFSK